jgi:hypothetical protein
MVRFAKLLVVALILNAVWRVGSAYWDFYRFSDEVKEIAQFSTDKSDADLQDRVMQRAAAAGLPVSPEAVAIRRFEQRTYIDVNYVRTVELVPRMVKRPWPFTVSVNAFAERATLPTGKN